MRSAWHRTTWKLCRLVQSLNCEACRGPCEARRVDSRSVAQPPEYILQMPRAREGRRVRRPVRSKLAPESSPTEPNTPYSARTRPGAEHSARYARNSPKCNILTSQAATMFCASGHTHTHTRYDSTTLPRHHWPRQPLQFVKPLLLDDYNKARLSREESISRRRVVPTPERRLASHSGRLFWSGMRTRLRHGRG